MRSRNPNALARAAMEIVAARGLDGAARIKKGVSVLDAVREVVYGDRARTARHLCDAERRIRADSKGLVARGHVPARQGLDDESRLFAAVTQRICWRLKSRGVIFGAVKRPYQCLRRLESLRYDADADLELAVLGAFGLVPANPWPEPVEEEHGPEPEWLVRWCAERGIA